MTTQKINLPTVTAKFYKNDIPSLDPENGAKLLFKYIRRQPIDEAEKDIAEGLSYLVEGLPLTLTTFGGYMYGSSSSMQERSDNLHSWSKMWAVSAKDTLSQYDKTLESAFQIALDKIPINARGRVNMLAFLSPDSIPEDLFVAGHYEEHLEFLVDRAE